MAKRTLKQAVAPSVDVWANRPKLNKIAIIGFTQHRRFAPFNDNTWEKWGLNDLYFELPESIDRKLLRWFQIHGWVETAQHKWEPVTDHPLNFGGGPPHPRDPNHVPWLRQTAEQIPVYLIEARPEVPNGIVYDKAAVFKYFSLDGEKECTYFTNSISWMLAVAIMELVPGGPGTPCVKGAEIGVWGVDMMMAGGQGSEYGYQRPSCEWLLGWARAAGVRVVIPDESDLLHTAFTYGDHKSSVFRNKLDEHRSELSQRLASIVAEKNRLAFGEAELNGAVNTLDWLRRAWCPGDSELPNNGTAPLPNMHKVAP